MKHTQGEWESDGNRVTCNRGHTTSVIADVHDIAMSPKPPFNYDRQQAIANAKLIAAAPKLLEALKSITLHEAEGYNKWCGGVLQIAQEAIKKATE